MLWSLDAVCLGRDRRALTEPAACWTFDSSPAQGCATASLCGRTTLGGRDLWWPDASDPHDECGGHVPMQEQLRRRISALVRLIVEAQRMIVYTDLVDQLGDITRNVALRHGRSRLVLTLSAEARAYLRLLEDHGALQKPRRNRPLAAEDLTGPEQMVIDAGVGTATCIATGLGPR